MFAWENKEFFWGFLLILFLLVLFFVQRIKVQRNLARFGDVNLLQSLSEENSKKKQYFKFSLVVLSLIFVVFSLANPLLGTKLTEGKRQGVDVVILLDVSNSMKAEDVKPNRLERAKQMIMKLIDNLVNDRIGIIVFAGEPYVQLPLTADYSAAKLFTSYIDTDIIPTQGTAIGAAIDLAVERFNFEPNRKKAMIIITDGENHEDDAISAAENAAKNNFVIHTIGMGTLEGGPIPIYVNGTKEFLKDQSGAVVTTKLDPVMLQKISAVGGGEFILNSGVDPDLSQIVEKIARMEKKEYERKIFSNFESQFQYPLFFAVLFLLIEAFISERRNKYLVALNDFFQKSIKKNEK
ncbi:VWA domain-containing protein [Bacteroidetes/Chlorobi group bacterium Naka2016]|jgi:Ca-activated chloride channel family protein|nr:MAG: VWA domain-containing protein [Bacteroidetes/Chlorobi group bacterium Naka2016]